MGVPYWKRSAADKVRYLASEIEAGEEVHPDTLEELASEVDEYEKGLAAGVALVLCLDARITDLLADTDHLQGLVETDQC